MDETMKGITEYSYHDQHWVIYGIIKSRYYTPETNLTFMLTTQELKLLQKELVT